MRTIKFRCFYRGVMYPVKEMSFSPDSSFSVSVIEMDLEGLGVRNVSPNSEHIEGIMQSTGLHDKNGTEIYEGDLIRYLNGEITSTPNGMEGDEFETDGAVFWDYEYAQWDVTNRIDVTREEVFTEISDYEVIGNTYQNPELLNPTQP